MEDNIVIRQWYDEDNDVTYCIRFLKFNDMWWAVLKDVCFALGLEARFTARRIDEEFLLKRNVPLDETCFESTPHSRRHTNGYMMLLVNEMGIYQCIDGSRKLEARKFRRWYPQMISKLRQGIGLEGFMAMEMMDERVQKHIDVQLDKFIPEFDPYVDDIFFDEETGILMKTVTLPGGDVEVVPYEDGLYSFR